MAPASLLSLFALTIPLALGGTPHRAPASPSTAEIDAKVWSVVSAAVAADDIAALGRSYHAAAVLVTKAGTKPIAKALDGWGKDMVTAKQAGTKATVAFRFSHRQDDADTAFESGIFRYATTTKAGVAKVGYTRYEALLVKSGGQWLMLMEHQLEPATEAAWNGLPH